MRAFLKKEWMEMMSDSLADAGFLVTNVSVDAFDSWTQFYKNIPLGLIIFVLMCSGIFTVEYQRGTLIPVVTKGLTRRKILAAKAVMLIGMWTVLYFLCYGITYGYNAWFWDNSITAFPLFGAVCYWLFGIWVIALMVFFSTVSASNTQVLLGTGVISFGTYLLGMFPKLNDVLPAKLMEGMAVLQGMAKPEDYYISMASAGVTAVLFIGLSTVCFDKRQL